MIWGNLGKGVTTYSLVSLMYVFDQLLARYTAFPSVRWCSSAARVMMGEIRAAVLPAPAAFLAMGNPSMKWHFEAGVQGEGAEVPFKRCLPLCRGYMSSTGYVVKA